MKRKAGTSSVKLHDDQKVALGQSGRKLALQALDVMLAKSSNIEKLTLHMQESFDASPMMFFKDIVMPLLPKQTTIEAPGIGKAGLQIVLTDETSDPLPALPTPTPTPAPPPPPP